MMLILGARIGLFGALEVRSLDIWGLAREASESDRLQTFAQRIPINSRGSKKPKVGLAKDSKPLEHGCGMIHASFPSFFDLGLEDGHVATF